jgi:hypothetical protein
MALLTHSPGEAFPARPGFGSPLSLPITRDCELATSHLARRGGLASSKIWKYFVIALHPKRGEHSFLSCWRYVEPRAVNAGRVVNAVTPRWRIAPNARRLGHAPQRGSFVARSLLALHAGSDRLPEPFASRGFHPR